MRHLKTHCAEEENNYVKDSLKETSFKEKKCEEEATEIVENITLRKEPKLLLRK